MVKSEMEKRCEALLARANEMVADWRSTRPHKLFKLSQQAIIQNDEGLILVLHEPTQDIWLLPGGRIEHRDSTPFEALKREVCEETSMEVSVLRPVGVDVSSTRQAYAVAFLCKSVDDNSVSLSNEHDTYKWISPGESGDYLYYKNIAKAITEQLG